MTIRNYVTEINFEYDENRKGAKYIIDNSKYANRGEFLESVAKFNRGYDYLINPATSYDVGSDIEQEKISVKSSKCSLCPIYGTDFVAIVKEYFNKVASKKWLYMTITDKKVTEYEMNKAEFFAFVMRFGKLDKVSKNKNGKDLFKVRLSQETKNMIAWLESRA